MTDVLKYLIVPCDAGAKLDPPAIYLFYDSTLGKRRRMMPVHPVIEAKKEKKPVDCEEVVSFLLKRHGFYAEAIPKSVLTTFVTRILEHHGLLNTTVTTSIPKDVNLNKLPDKELEAVKSAMDVDFKKNQVKKEDPSFVYDVKKDFGKPTEKNDWDSDSDEDESTPISTISSVATIKKSTENSLGGIEASKKPGIANTLAPIEPKGKADTKETKVSDDIVDEVSIDEGEDEEFLKSLLKKNVDSVVEPKNATSESTKGGTTSNQDALQKPLSQKEGPTAKPTTNLTSPVTTTSNVTGSLAPLASKVMESATSSKVTEKDSKMDIKSTIGVSLGESKSDEPTKLQTTNPLVAEKQPLAPLTDKATKTISNEPEKSTLTSLGALPPVPMFKSYVATTPNDSTKTKKDTKKSSSDSKEKKRTIDSSKDSSATKPLESKQETSNGDAMKTGSKVENKPEIDSKNSLAKQSEKAELNTGATNVNSNSSIAGTSRAPSAAVPPVLNPSKIPLPKSDSSTQQKAASGAGQEILDDISDDIIEEVQDIDDQEDEEFLRLLSKAKSKPSISAVAPTSTKEATGLQPEKSSNTETPKVKDSNPKPPTKESLLQILNSVPVPKKEEYNYEDDFEEGHTDEEIVFSDDGLSLSDSKSDDAF